MASDLDDFDPGVAVSGTFGAMFTRNLAAEATLGYYRATSSQLGIETNLNATPVLVSVRLVAPFKTMELSARAGAGIHFASFHATGVASRYESATAFGFHVGASVAFNLSPTMLVGLDALGTFASAEFAGVDTSIDGLTLSAKLGYRF
jgi:opacity protein-like surface antigen